MLSDFLQCLHSELFKSTLIHSCHKVSENHLEMISSHALLPPMYHDLCMTKRLVFSMSNFGNTTDCSFHKYHKTLPTTREWTKVKYSALTQLSSNKFVYVVNNRWWWMPGIYNIYFECSSGSSENYFTKPRIRHITLVFTFKTYDS